MPSCPSAKRWIHFADLGGSGAFLIVGRKLDEFVQELQGIFGSFPEAGELEGAPGHYHPVLAAKILNDADDLEASIPQRLRRGLALIVTNFNEGRC